MKVSVAVMAHPSRAELVQRLLERLDRPAEVVWDERNVEWHTGRRALLAFDPAATHHLVLQDDAVVCRDLVAGLEAALVAAPEECCVSLYVGRVRPYTARVERVVAEAERAERHVSWIVMRDLHWGVGLVLPTALLPALVRDQDRMANVVEYDRRISRSLVRAGVPVWSTWPSLIDHRDAPSLLHHGDDPRAAHRFVGEDASALGVDWSGVGVVMPNPRQAMAQKYPRRVSARPTITT